ncbi:hypothetical protein ACHAWF_016748 [Thalassiosira exigua]
MPPQDGGHQQLSQPADQCHEGTGDRPPPKPTAAEVRECQFSSWYPSFRDVDAASIRTNTTKKKKRKNVTIESVVVRPLPPEFIEYLLSDGVRLPDCATKVSSCMNDGSAGGGDDDDDRWASSSEDECDDDGDDGSGAERPKKYSFPDLTDRIQSALTSLGGERNAGCMPKLNWSSPKDSTWMNCGSLRCTKVGDVYLLLKSSDFVGFDLEKAWDDLEDDCGSPKELHAAVDEMSNLSIEKSPLGGQHEMASDGTENQETTVSACHKPADFEYELVLRKWCNLHPSMEFRCFVYEHELVAITQRHPSKFYPHLQPPSDGSAHASTTTLHAFFHTYIQTRFAGGGIHRYVVDLYLDSQERVWIVDFNVWGDRTDALLFDWHELTKLGARIRDGKQAGGAPGSVPMPEVRVVTKDMKSMTYDPLSSYRGPTDVMDILTSGNGDSGGDGSVPSFEEFMKQCVPPSEM